MIKFDIELKMARGLQLMILVDLLYETSEEEQFVLSLYEDNIWAL